LGPEGFGFRKKVKKKIHACVPLSNGMTKNHIRSILPLNPKKGRTAVVVKHCVKDTYQPNIERLVDLLYHLTR
jgi:hypothetical protein